MIDGSDRSGTPQRVRMLDGVGAALGDVGTLVVLAAMGRGRILADQQCSGLVLPGARHETLGANPPRRIVNTNSSPISPVLMIRTTSFAP